MSRGRMDRDRPDPFGDEPIDPDLGPQPGVRSEPRELVMVTAVMVGGVIGAVARYAMSLWFATGATSFPWTTFATNVVGSLALAIVVVLATERWTDRPLLRPLLGTGVIGGFTTFSTFTVDQQRLFGNGHPATAVAYLLATVTVCLAATWVGQRGTHAALARAR